MYFYLYYADILQAKVSWQCGNMMYLFRPSLPGIKMNYSRFELKNGFMKLIICLDERFILQYIFKYS